jgi:putative hydrolase of the HAD superfamily
VGGKWLVLDMMGVLFREGDSINKLFVPYLKEQGCRMPSAQVYALYMKGSAGRLTSKRIWEILGLGSRYPAVEKDFIRRAFKIDRGFSRVLPWLKKYFRLAVLSNDIKEWSAYLRKINGLNRHFKVAVISGAVKCRKPEKRIYSILLKISGAKPKDCVFVDDKARNLKPAEKLGFITVRFAGKSARGEKWGLEVKDFAGLKRLLTGFTRRK